MARKTAVRVTESSAISAHGDAIGDPITNMAAQEVATRERIDAAITAAEQPQRGLLPSLAEWRAARDAITERELLAVARSAARLEMRGENYSPDDRADAVSEMLRQLLLETRGTLPSRQSPRVTLTAFCDRAKTLRRSLDRQRERDDRDAQRLAAEHALSPAAIGVEADDTLAKHAAIVARYSEHTASQAVDGVITALELPKSSLTETDGGVWLCLYQWVCGLTAAKVAARRQMGVKLAEKRITSGAKFLREFYSFSELAAKLTAGGSTTHTVKHTRGARPGTRAERVAAELALRVADDTRTVVGGSGRTYRYGLDYGTVETVHGAPQIAVADLSMEARRHTPMLAQEPRMPSVERPQDSAHARQLCTVRSIAPLSAEEIAATRGDDAEQMARKAAALTRLARQYARQTRRRERATTDASKLGRAIVNGH